MFVLRRKYKELEYKYNKLMGLVGKHKPLLRINCYEQDGEIITIVMADGKVLDEITTIGFEHRPKHDTLMLGTGEAIYRGNVKYVVEKILKNKKGLDNV